MEQTDFQLSKPPIKVFKSIRVRKIHYETNGTRQVLGHLNYVRFLSKEYDYEKGDILDELILKEAKSAFVEANLMYNVLLLFDTQLKDCLTWTKGNLRQQVTTYFRPYIDFSETDKLVGKLFKEYKLQLNLNIQTSATIKKTVPIMQPVDWFNVSIPYRDIDKLVKTIEKV